MLRMVKPVQRSIPCINIDQLNFVTVEQPQIVQTAFSYKYTVLNAQGQTVSTESATYQPPTLQQMIFFIQEERVIIGSASYNNGYSNFSSLSTILF